MKKIFLFIVVVLTLTTTIFVVSCKKENNTVETKKALVVPSTNNVKGFIIDESNYKDYLDDPDVEFFFQDVSVAGIIDNKSSSGNFTLCVTGTKARMCRDFNTQDAACAWGAYCQLMRPRWYDYTINGQTWNCVCRGIGCISK